MKTQRKLLAATGLAAVLSLAGCWGGDDDEPGSPPAGSVVPDSAAVDTASLVSFILGLSASDESSEPSTFRDTFALPADETAEPTPLT